MSFDRPGTDESDIRSELVWDGDEGDESKWKPPETNKPCVLCGTQPQSIGLHCNTCWNDLADQDPLMWLPE